MPLTSVVLESSLSVPGPMFTMSAGTHSGVAVLSVSGELDQLTADHFDQALATVLYDAVEVLVVDLTDTTFLSTSAMSALVRVHHQLQRTGGELVVVAHGPATARPLQLVGLTDLFTVVDTIDNAVHRTPLPPDAPGELAGRTPEATAGRQVLP